MGERVSLGNVSTQAQGAGLAQAKEPGDGKAWLGARWPGFQYHPFLRVVTSSVEEGHGLNC